MSYVSGILSLIVTILAFTVLWAISLRTKNAAIADVYWGPGFVVIAGVHLLTGENFSTGQLAFAALIAIWGIRLGLHLWVRHSVSQGEDGRYALMRERGGKNWPMKSLFSLFLVQAIVQWLIALPISLALTPLAVGEPGLWSRIGVLIFAVGITFETLADAALARFKRNPENSGKLLTTGLFAWSRHPNYFGEILIWLGLAIFAYSMSAASIVFLSPLLLAFLIVRASGIPPLEEILEQREGFDAWRTNTNALIPWPPKRDQTL